MKEDHDDLRNTAHDDCNWAAHTKDRPGHWERKKEYYYMGSTPRQEGKTFVEKLRAVSHGTGKSSEGAEVWLGETPDKGAAPPKTEKALAEKTAKAPIAGGVVNRFPRSMHMLAIVSQTGAKKHGVDTGDMTYLDIPDAYATYTDAMVRHVVDEELEGPVNHKDGGLLHPAQVAWNALARLEVFLKNAEEPDAK